MDNGGVFIMKKYTSNSTNKLLISFIIKSIITTVLTVLLFTFLSSELIYKLDIDLNNISVISLFIVAFSSILISSISVYNLKNSGIIFGIISQIPLIFYMLINAIFCNNNWLYFFIKLAISVLLGALFGLIVTEKSKHKKVNYGRK